MKIQLKRVYEQVSANDGFRVFVDRLWPRGIKKQDLHYDLWAKELAPSSALRKWYHENRTQNWHDFSKQYLLELNGNNNIKSLTGELKAKKIVTLLYATKDQQKNHARILQYFLEHY